MLFPAGEQSLFRILNLFFGFISKWIAFILKRDCPDPFLQVCMCNVIVGVSQ
jgi:hypothetical protein